MLVKAILFTLLLFIIQHLVQFLYFSGYFKTLYNHVPGPCKHISGAEDGSEKIVLLPSGIALITSGIENKILPSDPEYLNNRRGKILLFDFNNVDGQAKELTIKGDKLDKKKFSPHGMSVWQDPRNGDITLFVVNHGHDEERVEVFRYLPDTQALNHIDTITDGSFTVVNDIVATSNKSFYASNTLGSKISSIWALLEMYLLIPRGNIVFYDGKQSQRVATQIFMANGIDLSPDKKYLYVNMFRGMYIMKRNEDNTLEKTRKIDLDTLADNLFVEPSKGTIWNTGQETFHEPMAHMKDRKKRCSSRVFRMKMQDNDVTAITEIFSDDGHLISCASIAVYHKGGLLIGSIYDRLLYCNVNVP